MLPSISKFKKVPCWRQLDAIGQVLVLSVFTFNLSPFSIGLSALLTIFKKVSMILWPYLHFRALI